MLSRLLLALLLLVLAPLPVHAQEDEPPDLPTRRLDAPDTRVGRQLDWVLRVINGDEPLGDLAARFSPRFIQAFGTKEIADSLTTMRTRIFQGAQVDLVELTEEQDTEGLAGILNGEKTNVFLSVFIVLDEKSGLIAGLLFNQAGYSCAAGDWDSYGGEFGRLGGSVSLAIYELVTPPPAPGRQPDADDPPHLARVYEIAEREPLHVGGAVRVWVLAALARAIVHKDLTLDQPVTLRAEWMSVPGSPTRAQGPGTTLSLSELATRAFAANDSTALDHVLHTVGRERVADVVREVARHLGRSLPVLSTREYLALKLSRDPDVLGRYAENDPIVRAELLRELAAEPDWDALDDWDAPAELERVGWIVSAIDQCRLLAYVLHAERRPGGEALAPRSRAEGDLPLDPAIWTDARFFVGREPGVISYAYLLRRDDNRWYALALTWNDEKGNVDEARLLDLLRAAVQILQAHERPDAKPDAKPDVKPDAPPAPGT